jgi:hypothetical protein
MRKRELNTLLQNSLVQRYSTGHPDILCLKKEIQSLKAVHDPGGIRPVNSPSAASVTPLKRILLTQINDIEAGHTDPTRSHSQSNRRSSSADRKCSHSTPELSKISRGYDLTL